MSGGVFVCGSLHWDTLVHAPHLPARDETVTGEAVSYAFGGKGGNQALAAALHGAPTAMAGRVGDDEAGRAMLSVLDGAGVDRSQVQQGIGPSGMSVAIIEAQGAYGAVIVSAANRAIDAGALRVPRQARLLCLQNEVPEAVNASIARAARAAGIRVVLNAAPARETGPSLMDLVDLLIVNRGEAAALTGTPCDTAAQARRAALELARGRDGAVVTLGGDGLVTAARETVVARPAHLVPVVSTHGAGDAFVGAVAARLAAGDSFEAACAYGQAAAALHVSRPPEARRGVTPEMTRALADQGASP